MAQDVAIPCPCPERQTNRTPRVFNTSGFEVRPGQCVFREDVVTDRCGLFCNHDGLGDFFAAVCQKARQILRLGSDLPPGDVAVQLREKDLPGRALVELARALRELTAAAGVAFYVNDRIDIALAVGADGVHLGGASLSPAEARAIAPGLAIGVSAHRIADLRATAPASFAVFGPIRDTPSKRAYGAPLGTEQIAKSRMDIGGG